MNMVRLVSRGLAAGAALLALVCCWADATARAALQAADQPALVLSANPKEPPDPLTNLLLRPNTVQPFYVWVKNPSEEAKPVTVVVKTGDGSEVARAALRVAPGKTQRVEFPKAAPAKPAAPVDPKAKPEPDKAPPGLALQGPPFQFQLELLEGAKTLQTRTVELAVMTPAQYVTANAAFEADKARLGVTVVANKIFGGPPCPVELVLRPTLLPGAVPASLQDGSFREKLVKAEEPKKVLADGLKFQGADRTGLFALTVDGCERAFLFEADLGGTAGLVPQQLNRDTTIRLLTADARAGQPLRLYSALAPKVPLALAIDTPQPTLQLTVAINLDRDKNGEFDTSEKVLLTGSRQQRVWLHPDFPDGSLELRTEVRDWTVDLNTDGVRGEHALRLQLLDVAGKEVAAVEGTITFDATPPDSITFQDVPPKVAKGAKLPVKARVLDGESPIAGGGFFFGALKDGKVPPDTPLVEARSLGDNLWAAELPLPPNQKMLDLSARFTNAAGLETTQSIKLEVVEPAPPAGTVKGRVTENERPQAGLEVFLRDDKEVKATVKTNGKGEFSFENVKPGPYTIICQKKEAKTEGTAPVNVEADKTKEVALELKRKPVLKAP